MKPCHCRPISPPPGKPLRRRWGLTSVSWGIPLLTLALVPKCPFCLAGYVALATGIGLSLTAANLIHTAMLAVPVGVLSLLTARLILRHRGHLLLKSHQEHPL